MRTQRERHVKMVFLYAMTRGDQHMPVAPTASDGSDLADASVSDFWPQNWRW